MTANETSLRHNPGGACEGATGLSRSAGEVGAPGELPGELWSAVAGRCARSVTVVSVAVGEAVHAITTTTFGVASLRPPLVHVTVAARGRTRALIDAGAGFAVSLLSGRHEAVARRCAEPGRPLGWSHLPPGPWRSAPLTGAPVVHAASAWLDCRLHTVVDLAGQALVVGFVEHAGTGPDAAPLVRFDGTYHPLHAGDLRLREGGDQS